MGLASWTLALAVLCSCGGTTGTEHIVLPGDASAASDVSSEVSPRDATAADQSLADRSLDAKEAGYDPFGDANRPDDFGRPDAKRDSTVAQPGDAGAEGDADAGTSAPVADAGAADADAATPLLTTRQILALFPGCLECIDDPLNAGGPDTCFDPAFMIANGTCEDLADAGTVQDEVTYCLRTLQTIASSECAAGMQLNPCLCGTTASDKCLNGMLEPTGPAYPIYEEDFMTTDINIIKRNIVNPDYGAGRANAIAQCVQSFQCPCFVLAGDGGTP